MEFSDTCNVISTLLPRTHTPPHVTHDINMEIRRGCATLSNIHSVLHPSICTWDLYYGLQGEDLCKDPQRHGPRTQSFHPLFFKKLQRTSKTSSSTSPCKDHPLHCVETHQLSLDLPLPTRPPPHHCETQTKEATFPLLSPCPSFPLPIHSSGAMQQHLPLSPSPPTAANLCNSTCPRSTSPPTAAELCGSCCPAYCHSPPPATSELEYIKEMLHTLCTQLLSS